jgi:uncharacterized membrane protein YfcA
MTILAFSAVIASVSVAAGFLGALTGLGGGVVIVPFLTLAFGVDIRYAVGASLVSVIATSSGAAAAYVKEGFSNIRIGMFLEIATTLGALTGAFIASLVAPRMIAVIFGLALIASALSSRRGARDVPARGGSGRLAAALRMSSTVPSAEGPVAYGVRFLAPGFGLMSVAGMLSGLLGIGSGAMKVIAMDRIMKIPFKVSTATSNFMIGVTAVGSAGIYLHRGYIDPGLTMPVMLGVLAGSLLGSGVLKKAETHRLRLLFAVVVAALGVEMIVHGLTGRF